MGKKRRVGAGRSSGGCRTEQPRRPKERGGRPRVRGGGGRHAAATTEEEEEPAEAAPPTITVGGYRPNRSILGRGERAFSVAGLAFPPAGSKRRFCVHKRRVFVTRCTLSFSKGSEIHSTVLYDVLKD